MKDNKSCLRNGKFTALVILICLISAIIIFSSCLILITIKNNTTDNNYKTPMWWIIWVSGGYVLANGTSAMVHRGWNFLRDILNKWKK